MPTNWHDSDSETADPGEQMEEERRRGRVDDGPGSPTSGDAEREGKPTGGRGFEQRDEAGQFTSKGGPGIQKR